MPDCIFCKIVQGSIPTPFDYEDDHVVVFNDLHPQAPHHKLIVPRVHIATLNDLPLTTHNPTGHMLQAAATVASTLGIAAPGYRVVMNCNADGGQSVFHIHAHLLGGRSMHWPPG